MQFAGGNPAGHTCHRCGHLEVDIRRGLQERGQQLRKHPLIFDNNAAGRAFSCHVVGLYPGNVKQNFLAKRYHTKRTTGTHYFVVMPRSW